MTTRTCIIGKPTEGYRYHTHRNLTWTCLAPNGPITPILAAARYNMIPSDTRCVRYVVPGIWYYTMALYNEQHNVQGTVLVFMLHERDTWRRACPLTHYEWRRVLCYKTLSGIPLIITYYIMNVEVQVTSRIVLHNILGLCRIIHVFEESLAHRKANIAIRIPGLSTSKIPGKILGRQGIYTTSTRYIF